MAGEVVPINAGYAILSAPQMELCAAGLRPPRCRHEKRDRRAEYEPISAPQKTRSGAGKNPRQKPFLTLWKYAIHMRQKKCVYTEPVKLDLRLLTCAA
jgi:hypothetical protein